MAGRKLLPKGMGDKKALSTVKTVGHMFKAKSFAKLTWCESCEDFIWGITSTAYQCSVCRMTVHKKCLDHANVSTNCNAIIEADKSHHSKFLEMSESKKTHILNEMLEQMQHDVFAESHRMQVFVPLVSRIGDLGSIDPFTVLRTKLIRDVDDSDPTSDVFGLLCSYLDHEPSIIFVALKVLKNLVNVEDNKLKFCERGHVSTLIKYLKHNPEDTEYKMKLEILEILLEIFYKQPELREHAFARNSTGKITGYIKAIMAHKERVKDKRVVLNTCKWVGAKLLWDFYQDQNKKYTYYLDARGALAIIIHAATEGFLSIWPSIDAKDITIIRKVYSSPICTVSLGTYNDAFVAVKEFAKSICYSPSEFRKEAALLSVVQHPNACKFHGAREVPEEDEDNGENPFLVLEWFDRGSLADVIDHKKAKDYRDGLEKEAKKLGIPYCDSTPTFDVRLICNMIMQAANGIAFLHTRKIIHRDIKPANFLVTKNWGVSVIDFGVSRVMITKPEEKDSDEEEDNAKPPPLDYAKMTVVGTPFWMAPEVLNQEAYNDKADTYSFAYVMWAMMSRKAPFPDVNPLGLVKHVVIDKHREEIPDETHPVLKKLISQCWDPDPDLRPSFDDILETLWDIQDDTGDYCCRQYMKLEQKHLTRICNFLSPTSRTSLSLTCKYIFSMYYSKNTANTTTTTTTTPKTSPKKSNHKNHKKNGNDHNDNDDNDNGNGNYHLDNLSWHPIHLRKHLALRHHSLYAIPSLPLNSSKTGRQFAIFRIRHCFRKKTNVF